MTILLGYFYTSMLSVSYKNEAEQTVKELSMSNSNYLKNIVHSDMETLKSCGSFIDQQLIANSKVNEKNLIDALYKVNHINKFKRMAILDIKGNPITPETQKVNVFDKSYFQKALRGETAIETGILSKFEGKLVTNFATPIMFNRKVVAVLTASIDSNNYSELLNTTFFDGEGYNVVVNSIGEVVIDSSNKNRIQNVKNLFEVDFENETVIDQVSSGEIGFSKYTASGKDRYAAFTPLGINDWIIFTVVPQDVITKKTTLVIKYTIMMWMGILAIFVAGWYFISAAARRSEKQNSELKILNNKYTSLVDVKGVILFEIDVDTGNFTYNKNYQNKLCRLESLSHLENNILSSEVYHSDDVEGAKAAIDHVLKNYTSDNYEVRVRHEDGHYFTFAVTLIPIFDSKNNLTYIMGYMDDITEQKSKMEYLQQKTRIDGLTKIYNKETTRNLIESYLMSSESKIVMNAMIAVDVDNFKGINDDFGHLFGDNVIVELAASLKSIFRDSDIVGRFGGDEFTVFLKNIPSSAFVIERSKAIIESFSRQYKNEHMVQNISASVGIALHNGEAMSFEVLYKRADVALYHAKNSGKSLIHMYEEDTEGN
jgi:diguanylate cyclase (GGDEF)-like protein